MLYQSLKVADPSVGHGNAVSLQILDYSLYVPIFE